MGASNHRIRIAEVFLGEFRVRACHGVPAIYVNTPIAASRTTATIDAVVTLAYPLVLACPTSPIQPFLGASDQSIRINSDQLLREFWMSFGQGVPAVNMNCFVDASGTTAGFHDATIPICRPLVLANPTTPIQLLAGAWCQIKNIDGLAELEMIPILGPVEFSDEFGVLLPIRVNHADATQFSHT
jgi:hypothetical protein